MRCTNCKSFIFKRVEKPLDILSFRKESISVLLLEYLNVVSYSTYSYIVTYILTDLSMLFIPITTSLKNNKQVTIRLASSNDASALLDLIKQYLDTSEYIPITSSDFNKTVAEIEAWIEKLNSTDNSIMLVAEHNGQLIGNLDLTGQHRKTLQHTAVLGMGILLEWRNTGLGTALLSSAVEWAKRNNTLEILTLEVYTENMAGIALYRKQGFKELSIIPNFIKDNDRYYDNMSMWIALR